MNSIVGFLYLSSYGSLLMGLCLAFSIVSAVLSISFYFILKHKSLIYFGLTISFGCLILGMANQDPQLVFDLDADPKLLRMLHLMTAILVIFYYLLVIHSFQLKGRVKMFTLSPFFFVTVLAFVTRILVVIFANEILIRAASITAISILFAGTVYCLSQKTEAKSIGLIKVSCCIFSIGLMLYPLLRSGFVPSFEHNTFVPFVELFVLLVCSSTWLFGLVEMAREALADVRDASVKNLARAFIQIRDLMNTPLQNIEFATELLGNDEIDQQELLSKIANAVEQMRKINGSLRRFENDVDWDQTHDFLNLDQI